MYPNTELFIDGKKLPAHRGRRIPVVDPATGEEIGSVAHASQYDLDLALGAAARGFRVWRNTGAFDRANILRSAARLLRERATETATILTAEQGKPLGEALIEVNFSADILDWFAEEARRGYGRVIPARDAAVQQTVTREPIGPVAAFTPWNFPVSQNARKIGAALAAGCSMIVKPPEDAPAAASILADVFHEAGLPAGVLNFVFGDPAEISSYLIPHPIIRKVSFTGSVPVGKKLAAMAGEHMKPATMELGGHAPAIVFDDADPSVASILVRSKYRNAGQVCVSPTRFLVQEGVLDHFVDTFVKEAARLSVGPGMRQGTEMGPLISRRRVEAIEGLIDDAKSKGANVLLGGNRIGNAGNFFEPTVLGSLDLGMRVMNEEPFGPLALIVPFKDREAAIEEANRLPYGLASYAFTRSAENIAALERDLEVGMLTVNHFGLALPETPFGGVKDSGHGSEGGTEAIDAYLVPKFVSKRVA